MLSYIKERFHGGYIPTGLQEGWMGVQTAFAEKDPVRRIFLWLRSKNYVLVNGHLKKRREALRVGWIYC